MVAVSVVLGLVRDCICGGFPVYQMEQLFHLNREESVPTWGSSVFLLAVGALAGLTARDRIRRRRAEPVPRVELTSREHERAVGGLPDHPFQ